MQESTKDSIEGSILLIAILGLLIYGFTYWVDAAYDDSCVDSAIEVVK